VKSLALLFGRSIGLSHPALSKRLSQFLLARGFAANKTLTAETTFITHIFKRSLRNSVSADEEDDAFAFLAAIAFSRAT